MHQKGNGKGDKKLTRKILNPPSFELIFLFLQDSHLSRIERRKKETAKRIEMEAEMERATKQMEEERQREEEELYGARKTTQRIATPGVRSATAPRSSGGRSSSTVASRRATTPRRFGL